MSKKVTKGKCLIRAQLFVNGEIDEMSSPDFFRDSDGRVTVSHIDLIKYIRALNQVTSQRIGVHTFDSKENANEVTLSRNLEQIRREVAGPLIVESGVIHAAKGLHGAVTSAAQILVTINSVFSVFIQYEPGMVNVEGELLNVLVSESQRMGPETSFDGIISVSYATPAMSPIPLVINALK